MVEESYSLGRLPFLLGNCCCSPNSRNQDMEPHSQILSRNLKSNKRGEIAIHDSIVVANNNNYLTSVIEGCHERDSQSALWSSNFSWTRKAPLIPQNSSNPRSARSCILGVAATFVVFILVLLMVGLLFLLTAKQLQLGVNDDDRDGPSFSPSNVSGRVNYLEKFNQTTSPPTPSTTKRQKPSISKQAWLALQKNEAREPKSVVVPTQLSFSKDQVHRVPCGGDPSLSSCCKLNRSTEVLERPGCRPIEIPKHQCVGGCDYVFLEGNPYMSIPKCQPVRTQKLKFKMNCENEVKRVTVEVVSRCRCA